MNQRRALTLFTIVTMFFALLANGFAGGAQFAANESLTIYSGRSESLVAPLVQKFQEETGINVEVRYGGTAELAVLLIEEGDRSPADLFWAQDGGALGALSAEGLFAALPASTLSKVPAQYHSPAGDWIATSGRARVLAYSIPRVGDGPYPQSIFDLTKPEYRGRVGWAPTNGSLQSQVTSMRAVLGDQVTEDWMKGMIANGAKAFSNNSAQVEAIAAGEIDFAVVNNYYLLRYLAQDANYPVAQRPFAAGDQGNLINVAGVGVLKSASNKTAAERFVDFLLGEESQRYITEEIFEYPSVRSVAPNPRLLGLDQLLEVAPATDFIDLADLEGTLRLMREAGAL